MAFRVEVSPRAFADLDGFTEYIKRHGNKERAEKWFREMIGAVASLEEMPWRHPVAEESADVGQEVRVLHFGRRNRMYKVYFSVESKGQSSGTVRVLHVRHWARGKPGAEELEQK